MEPAGIDPATSMTASGGQPTPDAELAELLELAVRLAAAAADRHQAGTTAGVETKSSVTDPVTEVDRDAEALIVDGITAARPHDAIVGEEGAAVDGSTGIQWVIDPLDGTVNFVYGFPQYSVSIGVLRDGEPIVAVVQDSVAGDVYTAVTGGGAFHNGAPLVTTDCDEVGSALLATGFGYDADQRRRQGAVLAELIGDVRDIRRAGSAALDLCHVAAGRVDAYYETGPNLWDVAAGMLIVTEAGGWVSYVHDERRILAAGRQLFDQLSARIAVAEAAATT